MAEKGKRQKNRGLEREANALCAETKALKTANGDGSRVKSRRIGGRPVRSRRPTSIKYYRS